MENRLKLIRPEQIKDNVFNLIGTDWMLIAAGAIEKFNIMTASWGGFGVIWGKQVCFCFIRPQRYTYNFMEKAEKFTLSFFPDKYKDMLEFCGSRSGRDIDKVKATGLTPVEKAQGVVYFNEARLVLECKKLYYQDINPEHFLDSDINKNYPQKDYHRMYIGEITECILK